MIYFVVGFLLIECYHYAVLLRRLCIVEHQFGETDLIEDAASFDEAHLVWMDYGRCMFRKSH